MSAIRREMDHVVVLNERQLRRLLKKYLAHYHGSGALVCKRTQGVCGPATADGMLPPTSCWSSHPYSLTAVAVPVRTPLRKPMLFTGMLYHATSPFRAYEFPETTSCSTCFSSDSSATSLSRRAFSSPRSFNRRVWLQLAVFFSPAVVRSARRYRLPCTLRPRI